MVSSDPFEITKKATKEKDNGNLDKAIEYMKEAISELEKI